eukprot:1760249-Prymnesium_polylepis.1
MSGASASTGVPTICTTISRATSKDKAHVPLVAAAAAQPLVAVGTSGTRLEDGVLACETSS